MPGNIRSRSRRIGSALWGEGRGWILAFVAIGWLLTLGMRVTFPALFPYLGDEFGLNLSTLGALYTALWATYALGQFPAGIVGDRIGDGRLLILSAALSAGAMLVLGLATGFGLLVVGTVLFGATSAMYGPARFTILSRIYSDYEGTAVGFTMAAGSVGNMALPVVAGLVASTVAWYVGFLYTIPLFLFVAVGLWFVFPLETNDDQAGEETDSIGSLREIFDATFFPLSLWLTAILTLSLFVLQGFTGFYPTYLVETKGISPTSATILFGLYFGCGAVVQVLAGALGDEIGTRRALLVVLAIVVLSLPLITVATTLPQIVLVTVLLSSSAGVGTIVIPRLTNVLPAAVRGSGLGLLRSGYFLIASLGSLVVGTLADWELFDEAFVLLAGLALVALALTFMLNRVNEPAPE